MINEGRVLLMRFFISSLKRKPRLLVISCKYPPLAVALKNMWEKLSGHGLFAVLVDSTAKKALLLPYINGSLCETQNPPQS